MTRPKLVLGVLAAACVGTLLWYAWLILAADLPRGATIAAWVLWLFSAAAVVTLVAYVREFLAHREAVGREASWKPLPSLVLLWLGGLTAMLAFAFVLPDKAPANGADDPAATTSGSLTAQQGDATSGAADSARSANTTSRSSSSRLAPPAPVSTTPSEAAPADGAGSSTSTSTDAATSAATTSTTSTVSRSPTATASPTTSGPTTSTPLIRITLPPPAR